MTYKDIPSKIQLQLAAAVSFGTKKNSTYTTYNIGEKVSLIYDKQEHEVMRTLGSYAIVKNQKTEEYKVVPLEHIEPFDKTGVSAMLKHYDRAAAERNT